MWHEVRPLDGCDEDMLGGYHACDQRGGRCGGGWLGLRGPDEVTPLAVAEAVAEAVAKAVAMAQAKGPMRLVDQAQQAPDARLWNARWRATLH